jgi:MinD-like ATPase involved in chromosome partitioning or flagellar assembly
VSGFDTAGDACIAVIQELPGFEALERVVLVRDLHGRVRLVWRPGAGAPSEADAERLLNTELGGWFLGPVLSVTSPRGDLRRIALELLEMAEATPGPRAVRDPRTGASIDVAGTWRLLSRKLAKHVWLSGEVARPPWPLRAQTPSIVAFHSFKGGVGRSTALGIVAWQLARNERVICVDLDLESPGLDRVLGATPSDGVLDLLLAWGATHRLDVKPAIVSVDVHGRTIDLLSAGEVNRSYVEKLARLDFLAGAGAENPTAAGLGELLRQLKRERYDWILLDNRSGLSDLAGLALVSMAHVDVLVARGNLQGAQGLRITAELLAPRRAPEEHRLIVAHTMAPLPLDGPVSRQEQRTLRSAAWEAFYSSFYAGRDDIPAANDDTGHHHPLVLPELDEIKRVEELGRLEESTLHSERYRALAERVRELAAPEDVG